MEGKVLGELKAEIEEKSRRRRDSNVAEKSVRSHFFSAPIIELLRLVFQLLFVGAYMGIGSNQPNWGCGYGGAGVFGPVRILVLASLVINREEMYKRERERLRFSK